MALLDRLKHKKSTAPKTDAAENAVPKKKEEAAEKSAPSATPPGAWLVPHVSEKAARVTEKGIYVFEVPLWANKVEIAKAVHARYKVDVAKVRTVRGIGKRVFRAAGRTGRRSAWKKALVQLKKGQRINLVEGV